MGLILVFDLDQTISDSSLPGLFTVPTNSKESDKLRALIKTTLNMNIVNLLKRAAPLRSTGGVSAICLLTNNSSPTFVSMVDSLLQELCGSTGKYKTYKGNINANAMPIKPYFFDSIFMRAHSTREKITSPPKSLEDVSNMMKFLKLYGSISDIIKNTYFFDDVGSHVMRQEFNFMEGGKYRDHYIQITPRYSIHTDDKTNYLPVLKALSALDGMPAELPALPPVVHSMPVRGSMPVTLSGLSMGIPGPTHLSPHPYPIKTQRWPSVVTNLSGQANSQQTTVYRKPNSRPSLANAFKKPGGSRKKRHGHTRKLRNSRANSDPKT